MINYFGKMEKKSGVGCCGLDFTIYIKITIEFKMIKIILGKS